MPDDPRTTWLLAFAVELRELRPHLSHKFAMTIGADCWPKGGDAAEAARAWHRRLDAKDSGPKIGPRASRK